MYFFYKALTILLSPFVYLFFHIRCLYGKDEIKETRNHFGIPTKERKPGDLIWIHAVSVGESVSALTYIEHIKKKFPKLNILITTVTVTSAKNIAAKTEKIENCVHQFVVADNPLWISKFLNYWNPKAAIFMESEIWPNLIFELHDRKIPVFLLNARLSPKAFKRWKCCRSFLSQILEKVQCILAQSKIDEERFRFFSPKNVERIPNLKLVNSALPNNEELAKKFKTLTKGKKIFVAASTHENEEIQIVKAHKNLKQCFDLITVIIPRHLNRVKSICEMLNKQRVTFSLRSEIDLKNKDNFGEILCVDSFGEVGTFFRAADVCFVGGTLVPIGGHNVYEPIILKKPVVYGPYTDNVKELCAFLEEKGVAFRVSDPIAVHNVCKKLFSSPELIKEISAKAAEINKSNPLARIDKIIRLKEILSEE